MATIKPKRGTGAPTGLSQNELAVNTASRIIYLGNTGGTGDIVASHTTVRGLSGTVGASAGTGISITNSGNTFTISLNAGLRELSDTNISLSPTLNDGLVWKGTRWQNTPVVLSLNGGGGDVTAVTSLAAGAGISLSGSTGAVTVQNIGITGIQISGDSAVTGGIILAQGSNVTITRSGNTFTFAASLSGASAGVTTLNGLSGAVVLAAGNNVTITPSGNTLTIAASLSGASAGVTTLNGLSGAVEVSGSSHISVTSSGNTLTITNQGVRIFSASSTTTDTVQGLSITPTSGTGSVELSFGVFAVKTVTTSGSGINASVGTLGDEEGGSVVTISNTGVHAINNPKTASGGTYGVRVTGNTGSLEIINTGVTFAQAGSGISVSGATGTVTITNAGVTGIAGTANEITVSGTTGYVTVGLPDVVTVVGLTTDYIDFNTAAGMAPAPARQVWNSTNSVLEYGLNNNVNCRIGSALFKLCHNGSGALIPRGDIVYVSGSQGDNLLRIERAKADAEITSAQTIGVLAESVAHGSTGFVQTFGLMTAIDTSGYTAGEPIYLSESVTGGFRSGIPTPPNHGVRVGFIVKVAGGGAGSIFINPQNYQELSELSDTYVSGITSNHMLLWDSTDGRWENRSPTDVRSALDLSSVVSTVNGATGAVIFAAGSNITITPSGNTFTIASSGGGGGGVSTVNGLSGAVGLAVGLGLTLTSSGNTLNIAGLTASTSQIGVASFNSTNFSVSGGVVSITAINGGTF